MTNRGGNILFIIFEFSDTNFLKMPWRILTELLPLLAKSTNYKIYVLTDTKKVNKVKTVIEGKNVKLLSVSKPILRYPYKGMFTTIRKIIERLNIESIVVFSGWNLGLWTRIAEKLRLRKLILFILTPVYNLKDLTIILLYYLVPLIKFGTIRDLVFLLKLLFENIMIRISSMTVFTKISNGKTKVELVVLSENNFEFFNSLGFKTHLIVPQLKIHTIIDKEEAKATSEDSRISIAYFGPLLIARGYDIVLRLGSYGRFRVALYSRDKISNGLRRKISKFKVSIVERFFENFDEIVREAEKHDLIILPFRFVVTDIPLVVLELACTGATVITTRYSNIQPRLAPNLIEIDLRQIGNIDSIMKITRLQRKFHVKPVATINWGNATTQIIRILRDE